jgi:hypothetical protein
MSAKGVLGLSLGCALLAGGAQAIAEDAEALPDEAFLEYLGMWEESEEDWLMFEESVADTSEELNRSLPQGEESVEQKDET